MGKRESQDATVIFPKKRKVPFAKVTLTGEGKLGAEATAKWGGKALIDADDTGWYLAPELTFEGLEVKGYLNIEGRAGGDKEDFFSTSSKNEFKWQAIDAWKEPKKFEKFYFSLNKE